MAEVQVGARALTGRASVAGNQLFVCEVRDRWTDQWRRISYLEPIQSSHACAPALGQGKFLLRYGLMKREDRRQFEQYYDIGVLYWYIRVLSVNAVGVKQEWLGVIDSDILRPHGGAIASGDLDLEAFGILHELDRGVIHTALELDGNGNVVEVDGCPDFNRRHKRGVQLFGNRSTAVHEDGAYLLSSDGEVWSNLDLAELILARHTSADGPRFVLGGQKDVLSSIREVHRFQGLSPFEALNKLIPRGRGIGYVPEMSGNTIVLNVYTGLETAVPYAGTTVPANARRISIDVSERYDMGQVEITRSVSNRYDTIEVKSKENMLVCMTMSYRDGNMVERWEPSTQEVRYILGASETSGYADLSDGDKIFANDRRRRMDDVAEVYVRHGLSPTWNKTAGSGNGGAQAPAVLLCDENGDVSASVEAPFVHRDKSFERFIPLEEGVDYGVNPAAATRRGDVEPCYLQPFALIEHPEQPGIFYYVNKVGEEFDGLNAHFKVLPRDAAIGVEADPPHVFALNSYDPDGGDPPSDKGPVFDYQALLATIAFRCDRALRVVASANAAADSVKRRTKVIVVPDAEYWYIVPGTCVGTQEDGKLKLYAGDPVLRNDVARMREIAAFALAWYGRERASICIPLVGVEDLAPLGSLVQSVVTGEADIVVGTVATCCEKNYKSGTSRLMTDWAELDFSGKS